MQSGRIVGRAIADGRTVSMIGRHSTRHKRGGAFLPTKRVECNFPHRYRSTPSRMTLFRNHAKKAAEIGEHLTMMNAPALVMTGASEWRRKFIIKSRKRIFGLSSPQDLKILSQRLCCSSHLRGLSVELSSCADHDFTARTRT
jgi:hypothetical protein